MTEELPAKAQEESSKKVIDKVDPRTGVFTRTHLNGEVEAVSLECGSNHFAVARLKSGDTVETEMPNLTLQLLQGVLKKVPPKKKAAPKITKKKKCVKRPAAQEAEELGLLEEAGANAGSDDDSEVQAIEPEEATVAEARKEWYKKYTCYGIKKKKDDGGWSQVMTVGRRNDEISKERKEEVAELIINKLERGMSVDDAKHLAAEQLAK